jgi:hypothetical protein
MSFRQQLDAVPASVENKQETILSSEVLFLRRGPPLCPRLGALSSRGQAVRRRLASRSDQRAGIVSGLGFVPSGLPAWVGTLAAGTLPAGTNRVRRDGKDDAGAPVASGNYCVRMGWDGGVLTRRVTVIR